MVYTVEKTAALAKLALVRFQPIRVLAEQAKLDPDLHAKFLAAFKRSQAVYDEFQIALKDTLLDESSDTWSDLLKHIVEVDDIFNDFEATHLVIGRDPNISESRAVSPAPSVISDTSSKPGSSRSNVHLPRIALPKFDGLLKDWPTYHDLFQTLIHENEALSNVEKFQYLISTLSKEPLSLVKHLPLTADNYKIAFESLVDRYQNSRVLATFYWQSMVNSAKVTSQSAQALRGLLNSFVENIAALNQFENVDFWDFTVFNLLLQKLDPDTRQRFELDHSHSNIPRFEELKQFLSEQCRALETSSFTVGSQSNISKGRSGQSKSNPVSDVKRVAQHAFAATSHATTSCAHCKDESHGIAKCPQFTSLNSKERHAAAKSAHVCFNCLSREHQIKACHSKFRCRQCSGRHHSMLHQAVNTATRDEVTQGESPPSPSDTQVAHTSCAGFVKEDFLKVTLLATIRLEVQDGRGSFHVARAIFDPGSQLSFVTESCRKRLGLLRSKVAGAVRCLGDNSISTSRGVTVLLVRPIGSEGTAIIFDATILQTICSKLPCTKIPDRISIPKADLADPSWQTPGEIDILLGADVFPQVIVSSQLISLQDQHGNQTGPTALSTVFGLALIGPVSGTSAPRLHSFFTSTDHSLDDTLKAFWQVEEVPLHSSRDNLEDQAEASFLQTHSRDPAGRFVVSLPLADARSIPSFVGSQEIAQRRLVALERRLSSHPQIRLKYNEFMQDYLAAGHMTLVPHDQEHAFTNGYFIPHHCIFKENGNDSKIRVVFDASTKDKAGMSLNDTLLAGPRLQSDIGSILLCFRLFQFVFTCDIRQMFRQILVADHHKSLQCILWRFSPEQPVRVYQLNTVTYGLASSPFLAIRCLLQLAQEGATQFPLASHALLNNLYVDDFACGKDSLDSLLELQTELIQLLKCGGYELRKWCANNPQALEALPPDHCQNKPHLFDPDALVMSKILGLDWQASTDAFSFTVVPINSICTKRTILSEVARIYDPLGFLSPLTLFAKRLIQHLWSLGLDWDAEPPADVIDQWERYKSSLPLLGQLRIQRCMKPLHVSDCSLHAFCDASERGYACVVYFRFVDTNQQVHISLVTAKTKVAPLKVVSIPRLELLAAVLLAKLVSFIINTCKDTLTISSIVAWSDSSVALTWIRSPPHKWKSFVANRVAAIQERVPPSCWRHVRSSDNPADPASRGLLPEELLHCSLWWAGPSWLSQSEENWPSSLTDDFIPNTSDELRRITLVAHVPCVDIVTLLERFSSLRKIQRIIGYCFRFINNSRNWLKNYSALTQAEEHQALLCLVKLVQADAFQLDISKIRANQPCSKPLRKLNPFIDSKGILRVGGRLRNSSLPYETKHPALLPSKHRLTTLIVEYTHLQNHHAGVNTTVYLTQQNFWILSARKVIRSCLSKCQRCFRTRPTSLEPPMADLPSLRVSQVKAFSCVGVDYGGPFPLLLSTRSVHQKIGKAYICLFVCFATKALHIELASDLTSETFIAALRRFIARRGRCSRIFSDCGTNFVGANKLLVNQMKLAVEAEAIEWSFNPPAAPHFGGLWESGIKSVKTHLSRVIGNQTLRFEELYTVVVQIEALLNSRPLCSVSSDPNDLSVITPGHFLTLEPLTAPPDPDLSHLKLSRLARWQLVQRLQQDFWKRWKSEYLHTLYQRGKWSHGAFETTDIGTVVLLKDENTPPLQWRLGRIVALHPGKDNIARVATVTSSSGMLKRPLVKLCPLPLQ